MITATGSLKILSTVLQGGLGNVTLFQFLVATDVWKLEKKDKGERGESEARAFIGCLLGGRRGLWITGSRKTGARKGNRRGPRAVTYRVRLALQKEAPTAGASEWSNSSACTLGSLQAEKNP